MTMCERNSASFRIERRQRMAVVRADEALEHGEAAPIEISLHMCPVESVDAGLDVIRRDSHR